MINLDLAFVIQIVNFVVLLFILNAFLYRPIRKVLADRAGELDAAKSRAEAVDREVQDKMAEYEARLRDVKSAVGNERAALVKEAQAEESAVLDKARKEASDTLTSIKERVAREAANAKVLLQEQARSLSQEICEKVLGRSL